MNKLLIFLLAFSLLCSCEQEEMIEAAPTTTAPSQEKAGFTEQDHIEAADQIYPIESATELEPVLENMDVNDMLVIMNSTAYFFEGLAPLWFEPGITEAREVCRHKSGLTFLKCVDEWVAKGYRVLIWKDDKGVYHAQIH